jgi:hypothetical protein
MSNSDNELTGSGGGTRTPDTRIMIPPFLRIFWLFHAILYGVCCVCVALTPEAPVRLRLVPQHRRLAEIGARNGHMSL